MIDTVIGSYRVVGTLDKGGMGTVYAARHTLLGRPAAIKVLLPELSVRKDIVGRFFNEARAATSVDDPGIVQVFDFGYHTDGSAYIVMELLEGETLAACLRRDGVMPVGAALRIAQQIASSLGAAHGKRIVHRDLKPGNIFLVAAPAAGGGARAKLLDFGIAKLSDDHPDGVDTTTGTIMGTPAYMSPEQCRGVGDVDLRSDIYSFGCVVFRMITGRLPFEAEGAGDLIAAHLREPPPRPSAYAAAIGPDLDELVVRCLQKRPPDRFQTMDAVIAAIAAVPPAAAAGEPVAVTAEPEPNVPDHAATLTTGPPPQPTTVASRAGQVARPAGRRSRPVALALLLAVVTVTAYLALRSPGDGRDAAIAPPPTAAIDAPIVARSPARTVDADDASARPPDAAPSAPSVDAGAPIDAPARRSGTARRLQADAATPPTDPLDLDGDGLPDVRR